MVIRRAPRPDTGWFVVSNQVARDTRLSYKARGLLLSLLSRPDDWRVGGARQLARGDGPDGETAILAALSELERVGYLVRERIRNPNGTFDNVSTIFDQPQRGFPVAEEPRHGFPGPANPGPDNPGASKRPKTKDPLAAQARRPIWDELDRLFGPVTNDGSRGRRAKAHKLLEQSGASPVTMRSRARLWKQRFPNAALTDIALANNWDRLALPSAFGVTDGVAIAPCSRCGSRRLLGYDKAGVEVPWDDPSVVEVAQCPCIGQVSA